MAAAMRPADGLVAQGSEDADLAAAALGQRLLQVVAVEVQHLAVARAVEDAAHGEFVIAGEDVAARGDAVADLEVELVGQVAADDAAGAVVQEGLLLVFGNLQVSPKMVKILSGRRRSGRRSSWASL